MRFIPSFVHGVLDYLFGVSLALSPWLLGFDENATATYLAVILGVATILYSLLTNYELGVIRILPFRIHLLIDLLSGVFLVAFPSLIKFPDRVGEPFVWFGIVALC